MEVSRSNFHEVLTKFPANGFYGLDTETTGLKESDRLFCLILANDSGTFHFNFWPYDGLSEDLVLPRAWLKELQPVFDGSTWSISDAKFDMHMLAKEGLVLRNVHCCQSTERILYNNFFPAEVAYSLAEMARRRGMSKDDAVEQYIKEHQLWTIEAVPGKKQPIKLKRFYDVPYPIMRKYAEKDAWLHLQVGKLQRKEMVKREYSDNEPLIQPLYDNECRFTNSLFRLERRGIKIDRAYTEAAIKYEQELITKAEAGFKEATGLEFVDGSSVLVEAFTKLGERIPKTATGRPSFTEDVLGDMKTPVAQMVNTIRKHRKRLNTYYSSFLFFADDQDVVRANYRQMGTETGRLSAWDPNMQNVPKEDEPEDFEKPFLVRGCFVPRPDHCFVAIDFSQQEYRMMLDYAGERALIDAINAGLDVHQATAELVGVSRKQAKTINFGILYGMGDDALASALGITVTEARNLRIKYFSRLPKVQAFIKNVRYRGEDRGYVWNWFGRRLAITDRSYAYILPNHIIQSSCADVIKIAINQCDEYMRNRKSGLVATIHDEILFEVHKDEISLLTNLKAIMEDVYKPKNNLYLSTDIKHSWKSWAAKDMQSGIPNG